MPKPNGIFSDQPKTMEFIYMNRLLPIAAAVGLAIASHSALAQTNFTNFTAIGASVPVNSLPEATPFQFGNAAWTQQTIGSRNTQLANGQFNTGSWDMIDTNRTGVDAGRYLFTVFETGQAGVQRTDLQTGTTTTLWNTPVVGATLVSPVLAA